MAIMRNNALAEGLSGMLAGQVVFRKWNGKTVVANRPRPATRESEQQKANRQKFKEATQFAKAMMLLPEKKAYYCAKAKKLKLPNGYTAAITDYMRKPVIKDVAVKDGNVVVRAGKRDFALAEVEVCVLDGDGSLLRRAVALKREADVWVCKGIVKNGMDRVRVRAKGWTGCFCEVDV